MMVSQTDIDWEDFKLRHEAAVGYAQASLKSLILVNGGAILALLTFLGNTNAEFGPRGMFYAFVWFSVGLTLSMLAHGLAYFVQESYLNAAAARMNGKVEETNGANRSGSVFIFAAALCCLGGLVLFITGAFVALFAIT